ncbi:uncharacterized protein LOC132508706 [Lagenorhynchus albirostris]|uniref:uncharacterized protein LOC132508706 n=1 Tax=Lagenorhynchus albirostris TaxID=27610 RepID=UPI0028EC6E03|nr:uncharacterized protein LOC132508706 [Lagenorhynchus albirostris]
MTNFHGTNKNGPRFEQCPPSTLYHLKPRFAAPTRQPPEAVNTNLSRQAVAGRSSGYRSGAAGAQERHPVYPAEALTPAGPSAGKRARRAEAPSPAARTGPQSARSRLHCPGAASPNDHGPSAASGTLAEDTMPTPSWGPRLASRPLGRPPPRGCGPAVYAGPASQPEDIGSRASARPAPPCRALETPLGLVLAPASTPCTPLGRGLSHEGWAVGAGLEDVSTLAVRPLAAPSPMVTRPEE